MRFLRIAPPTLDAFRRDVYRPRLALLLLVLLLSRDAALVPKSADAPTLQQAATSKFPGTSAGAPIEKWAPPGFVAAPLGPLLALADQVPIFYFTRRAYKKLVSSSEGEAKAAPTSPVVAAPKIKLVAPSASSKAQPSESSPQQQQQQPSPGSVFFLPKPSLKLLLGSDVITAFLPLHLLWLVRLLAMGVEDKVAAQSFSSDGKKLRAIAVLRFHAMTLFNLFLLAGMAVFAASAWLRDALRAWALHHAGIAPNLAHEPLLPLRVIVVLEASLTLLSLLPALLKLSPALPIPRTLKLPSPSHSPSLLEFFLPFLPPGVVDALMGRTASRTAAQRRAARRNRGIAAGAFRNQLAQQMQRREVDVNAPAPAPAAPAPAQEVGPDEPPRAEPHVAPGGGLSNPLTMQNAAALRAATGSAPTPATPTAAAATTATAQPKRAPRVRGLHVRVETAWLVENAIALYGRLVGATIYSFITLSLPTLSPTSLPPVVSLLSLRSELGHVARAWSAARRNVECLEFVRRRWGVAGLPPPQPPPPAAALVGANGTGAETLGGGKVEDGAAATGTTGATETTRRRRGRAEPSWRARSGEVFCAICFEAVPSSSSASSGLDEADEACCLDCGHEMHSLCLVRWLTNQAFCPTCHVVLSATPPSEREAAERAARRRRRTTREREAAVLA